MTGTATAIWAIVLVVVVSLAIWLVSIAIAARRPYQKNPHPAPQRGTAVAGGTHVGGGGRSVAPRRDAPAEPTADVTAHDAPRNAPDHDIPQDQDNSQATRRDSGNPLDL